MIQVNMHDAKTHLSQLVERVAEGEEIVIAKAGKPVARLIAFVPLATPRQPGAWRGRVHMADDFDTLPEELLKAFDGESS
ncbi:MAG: type II toxin-antitoxin system Phd/YefM family antitoxin [Candidatus Hydrogenedentes bacterium]|nr:type II toxin-antitoxin system Phd/YefM family antitoxin [Candidatus Hydrogenedentota bacterium]